MKCREWNPGQFPIGLKDFQSTCFESYSEQNPMGNWQDSRRSTITHSYHHCTCILAKVAFGFDRSESSFALSPLLILSSHCVDSGPRQEVESVNAEVVKFTLIPLAGSVPACISCRYSVPSIKSTLFRYVKNDNKLPL